MITFFSIKHSLCDSQHNPTNVGYFTLLALNSLGQIQILKKYYLTNETLAQKYSAIQSRAQAYVINITPPASGGGVLHHFSSFSFCHHHQTHRRKISKLIKK